MRAYIRLLRPHQWTKNLFVFTGIVFSHRWGEAGLWYQVISAAVAFSLASSGIYALNDVTDREQDRAHPRKRHRPVASGAVSPLQALLLGAGCLLLGLAISLQVSLTAFWLLVGYVVMNGAYSVRLKHVVILDIFIIAAGFMLRILVGTEGVAIEPSRWLLLCGFMLTLFLGAAKRRAELMEVESPGGETRQRRVLSEYSPALLDLILGITATGSIITYGLYTMSPEVIRMQGTANLVYTLPIVIYGLFRYLYRLYGHGSGGDPSTDLFRDPHLLAVGILWAGATLVLLR
ncbi:prenyltransferase [Acidihalobacter yilgarnensis]|uniref:Prenyltransferase n=1 Tax=Acidihalobacter yilgarnensis TaxID=2819280 RepID=A0A1D8INX3_9GAMM|nr:decaprenyl-phosphate phosphoribosyltransferase [Acidihalobacter yilgarnensis]AOU98183.1 prenyltransferase [Acidihalobacter yilgarnensis]